MDPERLTQKSRQAIAAAQDAATRAGHVEVDSLHLLLALLQQPDGLVPRLVQAMDVDTERLESDVRAELARVPRSTRAGGAPQGQVVVSPRLATLLDEAEKEARRLSDEYVSVEHLLVAMVAEAERSPAGRVLMRHGITRDAFLGRLAGFVAPRFATEDVEIAGVPIPRGSMVTLLIASANLDEAAFPDADTLDITRSPNRHVSFGLGTHFCLGAPLARLEARIAIPALLRRFGHLELAVPADQLPWRRHIALRGVEHLPLVVTPAGASAGRSTT